jgi:hypothetical protein
MHAEKFKDWDAVVQRNGIAVPRSPASFDVVRLWIKECDTQQAICLPCKGSSLPRRVLRIGFENGQQTAFLHESQGETAKHVTLCHCWGEMQPLITTKSTLSVRRLGIEWSSLPKTYQHAITITHGLGIEFLWIDSLCILQDDKGDWATESAKMGSIYENSWLTIAATVTPDGTHGCYPAVPQLLEHELQIDPSSSPITIYARKRRSTQDDRYRLRNFYNTFPLFQRAWVLPERLLARRVLHFCDEEMVWECTTHVSCECSGIDREHGNNTDEATAYGGLKYQY